MAALQVQTATQATGSGTSVVITVSSTVQNNLVVIHVKVTGVTETLSSVTDDKGNTYVVSSPLAGGTEYRLYQAYGVQVTGGVTAITCNFSSNVASKRCGADEYSGNKITNATTFDASATGTGTGTSLATGALSPAATGELIVATYAVSGPATFTNGTNYTLYNGVNPVTVRSQYRLSGTTSETAPCTQNVSQTWGVIATAFKLITTNIKTIEGLAKASVKTDNALAIASVKTINGLA